MAPKVRAASENGGKGETLDGWARRHFAWRERQGMQTHAEAGRKWRDGTWGGRWSKWISPIVESKGVATLSRDDVEAVPGTIQTVKFPGKFVRTEGVEYC